MSKVELIPAILEKEFVSIYALTQELGNLFDCVQIDVVDGEFASNQTWPYSESIYDARVLLDQIDLNYELDLMIKSPEKSLPIWLSTGAKRIIIHFSSTDSFGFCIDEIKRCGKEVGVAVTVNDNFDSLGEFKDSIDFVQCMGIERVGMQGESFTEKTYELIEKVKSLLPEKVISIDGGVSDKNALKLVESGAKRLVSGSFLLNGSIKDNSDELMNIINK